MPQPELISSDPCTAEVIWHGPHGDVDAAVRAATAAKTDWARRPLGDRIAIAQTFRDTVRQRADDFAVLIAKETGKPHWETKTEVASVAGKVDISIAAQAERAGTREGSVQDIRQVLRHKPHGVLGVLGPYNFPAHLPNGHIVPALLAGNTVVFKPSELTPAVAEFMAGCWRDAGLPDGVLTVVQGDGAVGKALAGHPALDGLLFTGSANTASALARQYADTPHKILALEAGGNNPLIVWDVEDLDAAASIVVQSAYLSSGQRCTCARRLIVDEGQADALIERIAALIDRIIVGAPFDEPQPFMGPVIDNRAADRLEAGAAAIVAAGGRALRPMTRPDRERPFLTPALIDVTGLSLPDEELFGPLLKIERVPDFDTAMEVANNTRFGLSAGLVGGTLALYDAFWAGSRAGVVNWNRPTTGAASNAPFGGIGLSGNHRPSAYYAADYCAWPVASLEQDTPGGEIATGLRD
ncbi:succinylglutamate-semialdehyde dehydrogenase [Croceicoccus bisphenolivorans]|uniref:succinylglutamate-semialdehyde dehydrogenase n=1 Tax=Croceicoccus bisphenolivorans TaxID=1783232 RepID=UPI000832E53F|nr:succinylglutamate-semialdehyde dehydrogenase [Croceicoccus bisphenolivorans]